MFSFYLNKIIKKGVIALIALFILSSQLSAQEQKIDEESTKLIRQYTTSERFLNPMIDHIPESDVSSPREILGYVIGTPKKLTYYADIVRYMKTLAEQSPRVELIPIGESNEGRMMYIVVIADEDTIKRLEEYKGYTRKLTDARKTDEKKAVELIAKAKPIYHITCNLHSSETGSAEMSMELAYRLAVSEEDYIKKIRDNVVTLITPCVEPDGHDRYTDWYYRYTKDITDERSRFPSEPPYWGKYIYHDNNRDSIQLTQPLSRNLMKCFLEWHPQIMHDLHESIPYLYVSTGTGPYYPAFDPIVINEWQWIAHWEVTELTKLGMPGVWTHAFFTGWYPGYLIWIANTHNALGRFYETFGNGGATTMERNLAPDEDRIYSRSSFISREWYRPWPPDKKVTWSMRNNINYQESGILSALKLTALNKDTILYNYWKKGFNSVNKSKNESPYAWVIPAKQRNEVETANVVNLLMQQGVEVGQAEKPFKIGEQDFPPGSYVVRLDQPYGVLARILLEKQEFPKNEKRPYDDVAWTLGLMHNIQTVRIDDKAIFQIPLKPITTPVIHKGSIAGNKAKVAYLIENKAINTLITACFKLKEYKAFAAEEKFTFDNISFSPGTIIYPVADQSARIHEDIKSVVEELGLTAYAVAKEPKVKMHELDLPRIALYHTWQYTQDSGWVRYTFDHYQIPFTLISKDTLRKGNLHANFDVIIIPEQGLFQSGRDLVFGIDPQLGPIPYTKTEEFKYLGSIDKSEDITGGMGLEGLLNLKEFVKAGGLLITIGSACRIPLDYGFIRYISEATTRNLFVPGSLLQVEIAQDTNPICYGYEKNFPIYRGFNIMFRIPKEDEQYVVLKYADTDKLCLSGLVQGEKEIRGKAAIVDVPFEKGHIVMFNFNPLRRFLNKGNFMLIFNALMNFNDLSCAQPAEEDEALSPEKE
jgi:hypothetical protein